LIIKYPTALYKSILPASPSDSASVTWTISSYPPPSQNTPTAIVEIGTELISLPTMTFNRSSRYPAGEYISNLSYSNVSQVGIGNRLYEPGEILEFIEDTSITSQVNDAVPDAVDLQQNSNLLDLSATGLTQGEIEQLNSGAWTKYNNLLEEINIYKGTVNSLGVSLSDNRRLLNETIKVKQTAMVVFGITDPITQKLTDKEAELNTQYMELVTQLDIAITEMNQLYNQLIQVKELTR
jgi:osmotically-inducible protein OsmY